MSDEATVTEWGVRFPGSRDMSTYPDRRRAEATYRQYVNDGAELVTRQVTYTAWEPAYLSPIVHQPES